MKKRFLVLAITLMLAAAAVFAACGEPADPDKADSAVYNTGNLYSGGGLQMPDRVKELKEVGGGWYVKTESDIIATAKMTLEVNFKGGKFDDVKMTISGADKAKYEGALEVEIYSEPEGEETNQEPVLISRKLNDPTRVKGAWIRLPRSGGRNDVLVTAGQNAYSVFNFDIKPEEGNATDHQTVGSAAFDCLEHAVAAYRFVLAAKNVFGSYANYTMAEDKPVVSDWTYGGELATTEAASATVKIDKVLEFPKSYIIFATSAAPLQRAQSITVMVRIDKKTHKVLKADYAFYHVSEYHGGAADYTESLTDAKQKVVGADVTKEKYRGMSEESVGIKGITGATLTNSVLVNAFNAAFDYYNANLISK